MQNSIVTREDAGNSKVPRVRIGPRPFGNKHAEILVQKEGEHVQAIVVTCPCGQKITIECQYSE